MELNEESQDKMIWDLGWALNPMTSVLRKTEGVGHVKAEAKTGVMRPQAKDACSHPSIFGGSARLRPAEL